MVHKKMEKCLCFIPMLIFLLCYTESVRSEVFTAVTELEDLVDIEFSLFNTLENYIRAEEEKLEYLKRYAAMYKTHYKEVTDAQSYVSNPINAYRLIKRLTIDWGKVQDVIGNNSNRDFIANINQTKKFPTAEDLDGAALALARLQETYRLDTSSLASGKIKRVPNTTELSASDCFELSKSLYNNKKYYYYAYLWLKEANARLTKEDIKTAKKSDIVNIWHKYGYIHQAHNWIKNLLNMMPKYLQTLMNQFLDEIEMLQLYERYTQLCRGEIAFPIEKSSKLKCRYVNKNHPFLLLVPFKVEEAYHKPDIFIYHEVLTDSEIATIRRLAQPKLTRASVQPTDPGEEEFAQYRISKVAWLEDHEHKHVADVSQRVSDMTGLTMDTAEELQVVNYGIGGHYEPHFDFADKDEKDAFEYLGTGNRIATVLFYMSDVEQGGATVFPILNVTLWPQKGAAAFWHNLHASGDGDKRTLHAACPVLTGSKWASNSWIHERGQEFLRPCTFERPTEDLVA